MYINSYSRYSYSKYYNESYLMICTEYLQISRNIYKLVVILTIEFKTLLFQLKI